MAVIILDPATVLRALATARDAEFLAAGFLGQIELVQMRIGAQWARNIAATAPVWRTIVIKDTWGSMTVAQKGGASLRATIAGAGAAGIIVISIAVAVGVYVSLGAGYYEARQRVRARGFMTGYSRGFSAGVLNWKWPMAASRFIARRPYLNAMDQNAGQMEAAANNEGLFVGFCLGAAAPDEAKKRYRIALRRLARRTDDAAWSRNAERARNEQIDYLVALAGAGLRHGLFAAE